MALAVDRKDRSHLHLLRRERTPYRSSAMWFCYNCPHFQIGPEILRPIAHRTVQQQEALTLIRARDLMVRLRTAAVNAVRGLTKACGYRMPASSTRCFAKRSLAVMPTGLTQALGPVLDQIAQITLKIKHYDRQILELTQTEYPETPALLKV